MGHKHGMFTTNGCYVCVTKHDIIATFIICFKIMLQVKYNNPLAVILNKKDYHTNTVQLYTNRVDIDVCINLNSYNSM